MDFCRKNTYTKVPVVKTTIGYTEGRILMLNAALRFLRNNPSFILWIVVCFCIGHAVRAYAVAPMVHFLMTYWAILTAPLYFVFRVAFRWEHKRAIRAYLDAKHHATPE